MNTSRYLLLRAVCIAGAILTFALGLSGCSHKYSTDDTGTDGAGVSSQLLGVRPGDEALDFRRRGGFYPHAVGNRWDYHIRTHNEITTDAGPQPPQIEESALAIEITRTEQIGDLEYFVQHEFDPAGSSGGSEFKMRESRQGLFELDDASAPAGVAADGMPADPLASDLSAYVERTIADPARRAAFQRAAAAVAAKLAAIRTIARGSAQRPAAAPGEITLLRYPLYVGARWIVRDDPRFARIVVARERINLPLGTFPAWKLRGTAELFGPEDRVHFWYSNLGLLRLRFHLVADVVDEGDHVIGRVVTDSDQSLREIHLTRIAGAAVLSDIDLAKPAGAEALMSEPAAER